MKEPWTTIIIYACAISAAVGLGIVWWQFIHRFM